MRYPLPFKGILTVCFFIAFSISTFAQCDFKITGFVRDADTGEPLPFSSVAIKGKSGGVMADEKGRFDLFKVCPGDIQLSVSHLACEKMDFHFTILGDTILEFELPHRHNELQEIIVVRNRMEYQPFLPITEIQGRDLQKVSGGNLADALEQVEGVTSLKTGVSVAKPMIHGLTGNRVLILNNGIRQEGQQWGNEHAPEIDPFIAKRITVIKGAASVRYGPDAIAGVVLIETPLLPSGDGWGGEFNSTFASSGRAGALSGALQFSPEKLKNLGFRLQGTSKKAGDVRTPTYLLQNTGYTEDNFSWSAGWNSEDVQLNAFYSQFNSKVGIFTGSHIGNLTDLEAAFVRDEPLEQRAFTYNIQRPYQSITHELFKLSTSAPVGDLGRLSLNLARQYNLREEFDKDFDSTEPMKPELNYEITSKSGELVWDHTPYFGFNGTIGFSLMQQANTFEGRMFIPNYENLGFGGFIFERWSVNRWTFESGARFDTRSLDVYFRKNNIVEQSQFNYQSLSGQAGVLYEPTDSLSVRLSISTGWRPPGVNEMFSDGLHHGASSVEIGNPELNEEKSVGTTLTFKLKSSNQWNFDLSSYGYRYDDFIYLQPVKPATLTIRGAYPTFRYNQGNVDLYGVDANVSKRISPAVEVKSGVSSVRARNTSNDSWVSLIPSDRIHLGLDWTRWSLDRMQQWNTGLNAKYVFRQNKGDSNDYIAAPQGYLLLNYEFGYERIIKGHPLQLSISVDNILDHTYRDYLNRYRYFADEEGINFTIRIRKTFGSVERKEGIPF
ncbi:MAG: TonB-dependent receptor [Bacteroidota bacterium]|jgi:iron complex outermembrane receptor protein